MHQLLIYVHEVKTMGGSKHTIKKVKEALVVASMKTGLDVDAQKTTSRIKSYIKMDNNSINMVEQFKYLETPQTNQNSTHKEIKNKSKPGMFALVWCRIFVFQLAIQKYTD
jgi:hypothetical protein